MKLVKSMRLEEEVVKFYDNLAKKHEHLGSKASAIMAFDLKKMMLQRKEKECHDSSAMAG